MKKNPVYESMTKLSIQGWMVRVWRTEKKLGQSNNKDIVDWAYKTVDKTRTPKKILGRLAKFDRVCAIELLDCNGDGYLFYPDWN